MILKPFQRENEKDVTSRAQMPLVIGRSHSEKLTFSALLCEQMKNEKERQTTKQKNIARQVLVYTSKKNLLTKN